MPPPIDPYAPPQEHASPSQAPVRLPDARLSVDGAFGRAFELMKRFLFRPFDFGKWFVFAFIVWLAELDDGTDVPTQNPFGGSGSSGGGTSSEMNEMIAEVRSWLAANLGTVIAIVAVTALVSIVIGLVVMWLSSRGHMMALRAIAHDHSRLGEHWRETRSAAWSYFGFRVLLGAITLPLWIAVIAWGIVDVVDVLDTRSTDPMHYVHALIGPILVLVVLSIAIAPIHFLGRNVLSPMLLRFDGGLRPNWTRTMNVVKTSMGGLAVFMLVKMLIGFVQGIAETILVYVTCCIGGLPVVHQVVSAPFKVFERAYMLAVIESLGPDHKLIVETQWPPPYPQTPYAQYPPYTPPGYGP